MNGPSDAGIITETLGFVQTSGSYEKFDEESSRHL